MSDFDKFLSQTATSGLLSIMLSLGDRLKLFESLSKVGSERSPATAADVAKPLNLRPRYVQEWLCCMAAGDIVEVDSSGLKFWIKEDRVSSLCGDSIALSQQKLVPLFSTILPKVTETFKVEGPMGVNYDQYDNIHKVIDEMSRSQQNKHLIADVIPLTGMRDKLIEGGLNVLDIGCGNGCQVLTLAEHYPKCKFTAIDLSADALVHAEELGRQQGLSNVTFIRMNAQKLDDKWSDSFDLITNFDACHDQTRPDLSLKETHRVLKSNGSFAMLEMNGTGNVVTDKVEFGKTHATLGYALSTMACLQFGSQSEDALCLGTMWGRKKAVELLEGAGFGQVNVIDTPFLSTKVLYVCHKY